CGSQWADDEKTAPVGSFPANAFGLHDMNGNVWEWVEDCYQRNYNGAPTDGSALMARDCINHVVRGGFLGGWGGFPPNAPSASPGKTAQKKLRSLFPLLLLR